MKSTKLANIRLGFAMLTFLNSPPVFSQVELSAGAESAGLADVRVGIENVWAVYNNPADMLSDSQFRIGVFAANPFNVDALKSVSMSSIVTHRNFAFGVYYSRFGYRSISPRTINPFPRSSSKWQVIHRRNRFGFTRDFWKHYCRKRVLNGAGLQSKTHSQYDFVSMDYQPNRTKRREHHSVCLHCRSWHRVIQRNEVDHTVVR